MIDKIEISKDALLEVLWGICLSDHMGDVMRSIGELTKPVGINECMAQDELLDTMKRMDLIPEYQR